MTVCAQIVLAGVSVWWCAAVEGISCIWLRVPVWAGVHVTLLQFGLGFDVLWVTLAVLLRHHFISADVYTICRV